MSLFLEDSMTYHCEKKKTEKILKGTFGGIKNIKYLSIDSFMKYI